MSRNIELVGFELAIRFAACDPQVDLKEIDHGLPQLRR